MPEPTFTPDEWAKIEKYGPQAFRAAGYFACALLLLSANTYPINGLWSIAIAIGLLGAASASARIGQAALAVLLAMALIPYPMVAPLLQ